MIKVNDIVKYTTPMNPVCNWGIVKCISEIKESVNEEEVGSIVYRVIPLEPNNMITHMEICIKDILESYSKQYLALDS